MIAKLIMQLRIQALLKKSSAYSHRQTNLMLMSAFLALGLKSGKQFVRMINDLCPQTINR